MADTSEENEDVSDILILSDPEATASLATLSPSLKSSSASDEAFSRVPSRLYDVPVNIDNKPAEYGTIFFKEYFSHHPLMLALIHWKTH